MSVCAHVPMMRASLPVRTRCALSNTTLHLLFAKMAASSGAHRVHSWEKASRSWEQSALVGSDSDDDDDPASAGEALVDFLCELKFCSECVLASPLGCEGRSLWSRVKARKTCGCSNRHLLCTF